MSAPQSISSILLNAQSPVADVRTSAEKQLKELENLNFPTFMYNLCERLEDVNESSASRMLAGLLLKNTFTAKDEQTKLFMDQRWVMLPADARTTLKAKIVKLMSSPAPEVRSVVSQVTAKIAAIEVPRGEWADFIDTLLQFLRSQDPSLRESSLESLQFVGEEVASILQHRSGDILNIIATCLSDAEKENRVKLAAAKALSSALEIAENNMCNPSERALIMQMIFSTAQFPDEKIRVQAYQALVKIAMIYYSYIPEYIDQCIAMTSFAIKEALQGRSEVVGLQGIEFWSSVCDAEIEIIVSNEEAISKSLIPESQLLHIMKHAIGNILPLLYEGLIRQHEDISDDSWGLASAAGNCLTLAAQVVQDDIVPLVLPFVQENINNPNWRFREAATLVFGSILGGPSNECLTPLISAAYNVILEHVKDSSPHVRDTTAWTIGRICESCPLALTPEMTMTMMNVFLHLLHQEPRIASLTCWAIHNLASSMGDEFADQETSPMSQFFPRIVSELYTVTTRSDADEANLLSSAFESINLLILYSAKDSLGTIEQMFNVVLTRMQETFQDASSSQEIQGYLCSCLQAILQKLSPQFIAPNSDMLMLLLIKVLENENALLYEEALMAVGAVINAVGPNFRKYIEAFKPFLLRALSNVQDHQVNIIAVSVVGDLCSALGADITSMCDEIVTIFLQNLQSNTLDRDAKPQIFTTIGQIAMAITNCFPRYLPYVMMVLVQASQIQIQNSDVYSIEFLNSLRQSILDSLVGIITGLREGRAVESFKGFIEPTVQFLDTISSSVPIDDRVLASALGLIGDLVSSFGHESSQFIVHPCISSLVKTGVSQGSDEVLENAQYAQQMISRVHMK